MRHLLITLTLSFILLGLPYSNTLHVPEEYGTIQIALNSANENDTVLVEPGTYHENIFGMKLIQLNF